jgi:hypothetical protein
MQKRSRYSSYHPEGTSWAMRSFHDQKTEINREEMMEFIVHQHTIIFELTSGIAPAKEGLRYFENLNVLQKPNPVK